MPDEQRRPDLPTGLPALVHWTPTDDVIEHTESERCVCGPHREPIGDRKIGYHGGQRVFALVHQRLDGKPTGWEQPA